MLGFIKRISREPVERLQDNFIRYAVCRVPWRVWPLLTYDAKCLLIGLEILSDTIIVAKALFVRDILAGRVDCVNLALMLIFSLPESVLQGKAFKLP
jgi:hypothetical protein